MERIAKLFVAHAASSDELAATLLHLLLNLSFDSLLRARMLAAGLVPTVAACVTRAPAIVELALQLLYHCSMHDECKSMLTYTDTITTVCSLCRLLYLLTILHSHFCSAWRLH